MPPTTFSAESYLENQRWLYNFVRKLVADDFAAEDIVHETFEQALRTDAANAEHKGWLKGVAFNLSMQYQRLSSRRRKREQFVATAAFTVMEQTGEVIELATLVMCSIERLPTDQQQAILMRHMFCLKPTEIANQLEVPKEQVYRLLERGGKRVQDDLKQRHGINWRMNCAAIIGFRIPPSTLALPKVLAIAATVTIVVGGIAAGLFELFAPPTPALSEIAALESPAAMNSAATAIPAAEDLDLELLTPLSRDNHTPPINDFYGVLAHVTDSQGLAAANASVTAFFLEDWPARDKTFFTDEDGYALIALPADVTEVNLIAKAESSVFHFQKVTLDLPAPVFELEAINCSWPQTFRSVDYLNRPLAGVLLEIRRQDHSSLGVFRTGTDGLITAQLPGPGDYWITAENDMSMGWPTFPLSAETMANVIDIPSMVAPTEAWMQCVDSSGAPIVSASFQAYSFPRDEFNQAMDVEEYALDAVAGRAQYPTEDPAVRRVEVRAPGYLPAIVNVLHNTEPDTDFIVTLKPQDTYPARIVFEDSERTVTSAVLSKSVDRHQWPPSKDSSWGELHATVPFQLEVTSDGRFDVPYEAGAVEPPVYLLVTDDLGEVWNHQPVFINQLDRDAEGLPIFFCPAKPNIPLTLTVLFNNGAPVVHERLNLGTYSPSLMESSAFTTDENGQIHMLAYADDTMHLHWNFGNLYVSGDFNTPAEAQSYSMVLRLPELSASLTGSVFFHDGLPVTSFSPSAETSQTIPLETQPGTIVPLDFSVSGNKVGTNDFVIANIPAGTYETTVQYKFLVKTTEQQSTGHDHSFTLPAFQALHFLVVDEHNQPIPSAYLTAAKTATQAKKSFGFTRNGSLSIENLRSSQDSIFIVHATGFAPQVIRQPVEDQITQVTLPAGREILIEDTAAEYGIALNANNTWIVDAWTDAADPRQVLVHTDFDDNKIRLNSAPIGEFHFVEIDSMGFPTGRAIFIPLSN
jgi:RNA polymerase sigma factor (sigma-70 family)